VSATTAVETSTAQLPSLDAVISGRRVCFVISPLRLDADGFFQLQDP